MKFEYKKPSFLLWPTYTCKIKTELFALCKSKSLKPKKCADFYKVGFNDLLSCLDTLHGLSKLYKDSNWRERKAIWRDLQEMVCWIPWCKSECVGYSQHRSSAFLFAVPRVELEPCACFTNTLPTSYIPGPIFPHILDQNIFSSKASWMVLARHAYIELFEN